MKGWKCKYHSPHNAISLEKYMSAHLQANVQARVAWHVLEWPALSFPVSR